MSIPIDHYIHTIRCYVGGGNGRANPRVKGLVVANAGRPGKLLGTPPSNSVLRGHPRKAAEVTGVSGLAAARRFQRSVCGGGVPGEGRDGGV